MSKVRRGLYGLRAESEAAGPMRERETLQPRDSSPRKGGMAEPLMPRRRQQTASARTGSAQDVPGVWRRACGDSSTRNRRDPPRRSTSDEGGAYKPKAKGPRAGRESEGLVVPKRAATRTPPEGRGPALIVPHIEGKREGMPARANHPVVKAREPHRRLFASAKRREHSGVRVPYPLPGVTSRWQRATSGLRCERACDARRSSVSRVRETRTHGLNGGHRSPGPQGHRA